MKVILDTNVFISGVFFTGPPFRILEAWRDGKIKLVISSEILEEYKRVGKDLAEQFPVVDLKPILQMIVNKAEMFQTKKLSKQVCDDPHDDKFLACALASKTKTIISGDKHLLKVSGFGGIQVLTPRVFVDKFFI